LVYHLVIAKRFLFFILFKYIVIMSKPSEEKIGHIEGHTEQSHNKPQIVTDETKVLQIGENSVNVRHITTREELEFSYSEIVNELKKLSDKYKGGQQLTSLEIDSLLPGIMQNLYNDKHGIPTVDVFEPIFAAIEEKIRKREHFEAISDIVLKEKLSQEEERQRKCEEKCSKEAVAETEPEKDRTWLEWLNGVQTESEKYDEEYRRRKAKKKYEYPWEKLDRERREEIGAMIRTFTLGGKNFTRKIKGIKRKTQKSRYGKAQNSRLRYTQKQKVMYGGLPKFSALVTVFVAAEAALAPLMIKTKDLAENMKALVELDIDVAYGSINYVGDCAVMSHAMANNIDLKVLENAMIEATITAAIDAKKPGYAVDKNSITHKTSSAWWNSEDKNLHPGQQVIGAAVNFGIDMYETTVTITNVEDVRNSNDVKTLFEGLLSNLVYEQKRSTKTSPDSWTSTVLSVPGHAMTLFIGPGGDIALLQDNNYIASVATYGKRAASTPWYWYGDLNSKYLTEISRKSGVPKTQIGNLLDYLTNSYYIRKDKSSGKVVYKPALISAAGSQPINSAGLVPVGSTRGVPKDLDPFGMKNRQGSDELIATTLTPGLVKLDEPIGFQGPIPGVTTKLDHAHPLDVVPSKLPTQKVDFKKVAEEHARVSELSGAPAIAGPDKYPERHRKEVNDRYKAKKLSKPITKPGANTAKLPSQAEICKTHPDVPACRHKKI
jgi:hypothetical protein